MYDFTYKKMTPVFPLGALNEMSGKRVYIYISNYMCIFVAPGIEGEHFSHMLY